MQPTDYQERYDQLPKHKQRILREQCLYWGIGNATTFYKKIAGYSLKRIDRVLLVAVFAKLDTMEGTQLTIDFDVVFSQMLKI